MYVCMCACMHVSMYICMYACMYVCALVCLFGCLLLCMLVFIDVCKSVCKSIKTTARTLVAEKLRSPSATSGGWNEGVPANFTVTSSSENISSDSATPKSIIFSLPSDVSCKFEGFMSRCTTPCFMCIFAYRHKHTYTEKDTENPKHRPRQKNTPRLHVS